MRKIGKKAGWAVMVWFFVSLLAVVLVGSSDNVLAAVVALANFAVSAWLLRKVEPGEYFPGLMEGE